MKNKKQSHPTKSFKKLLQAITGLILTGSISTSAAGLLKVNDASQSELEIRDHQVQVTINNGFAQTEVFQTFYNPNSTASEALYVLPLPQHASLSEMEIMAGEQLLKGEVIEKKKAQQIYQEEKEAGNNVGMAEKSGYQRLEFWVSNVPALGETTVKTVYYQPIEIDTGTGRYLYPLEEGGTDDVAQSFWQQNSVVKENFSIDVKIKSAWPIAGIRVPHYTGSQDVDETGSQTYRFQSQGGTLSEDFVLYYQLQKDLPGRVEVIPFKKNESTPGTFMMVVTPGTDLKPLNQGSDYVFVLDTSGSMNGKLHTLVSGVKQTIATFQPQDRFRIVLFNDSATELTRDWVPATAEQVQYALQQLDSAQSSGGTNLYAGIKKGLNGMDADRVSSMILVTDGVTNTGEVSPVAFAKLMQKQDIRVFGFLMGNSSNWELMDQICTVSGGYYKSVSNSDDIIGQILLAKSKVLYECMHNVEIKIKGVNTYDLSRTQFKKVFRGQQLIVFGKYDQAGEASFEMTCRIAGVEKTYSTDFKFSSTDIDNPELERLWALSKIEDIEWKKQLGLKKEGESEEAITDLALQYQLVTDYTSMIVLDNESFQRRGIERRNAQRTADEHLAQSQRNQAPAKNYQVDKKKKAFKYKAPRLPSGGGGAIDPLSLFLLAGLPFLKRFKSKK